MKHWTALVVAMFALVGCSETTGSAKLPATDDVLSRYQTIHVGSERLTLPTIALLSSTKHSNLILSDGSPVPIQRVLAQRTNGSRDQGINRVRVL